MKKFAMALATAVTVGGVSFAALPAASASAAAQPSQRSCVQRVQSRGTINQCVSNIQFMLNLANGAHLTVDNNFGRNTQAAVRAWQDKKNIKVDGIVGPQTWRTLCRHTGLGAAQQLYSKIAVQAGCQLSAPGAI